MKEFTPSSALIIAKQTLKSLAEDSDDETFRSLLDLDNPERESILSSDEAHRSTLAHVVDVMTERGIECRCVERKPGESFDIKEDMIVTVGGDGTFLDTSHSVLSAVPMLGVNSAPSTSHGHFCLTAEAGFEEAIDAILSGQQKAYRLLRLQLLVDDDEIPVPPVLNEVLIAHSSPAGTSRYTLEVDDKERARKSSGLVVATPSGSTGLFRSNGGSVQDITDSSFQFLEPAPFIPPEKKRKLLCGSITDGKVLKLRSQMQEGKLFIDGAHIEHPLKRGTTLTVQAHNADLIAFIDPNCHDKYK